MTKNGKSWSYDQLFPFEKWLIVRINVHTRTYIYKDIDFMQTFISAVLKCKSTKTHSVDQSSYEPFSSLSFSLLAASSKMWLGTCTLFTRYNFLVGSYSSIPTSTHSYLHGQTEGVRSLMYKEEEQRAKHQTTEPVSLYKQQKLSSHIHWDFPTLPFTLPQYTCTCTYYCYIHKTTCTCTWQEHIRTGD